MTSDSPLIRPSDARSWSLCARRAWFDNKGEFEISPIEDDFQRMLTQFGLEHEKAVLRQLASSREVHRATSREHTRRLMAEGVPLIYQAQLVDVEEGLTGYPDFLIRHENGDYQAADAKLALNTENKEIQVQLGFYRRLLHSTLPALVYLGDGSVAEIGDEANDVTERFIREMRALLSEDQEPPAHYSHSKCSTCPYYHHCTPAFEAQEELSLLYGVDGRAVPGLEAAGISTITELAASNPDHLPDVPFLKGSSKKQRAVLQAKSYLTGELFQTAPILLPEGAWVHFDIEDNPLTDSGEKHVYLWGFLLPAGKITVDGQEAYDWVWTDDETEDEEGWLRFLQKIEEYRNRYPSLVLAHYSNHERTTIRMYAERYGMQNDATVIYLLGEDSPLFDIQKPVLQSLVLPLQGYGLKAICKHRDLVNFQWRDEASGSQWSIVQFNHFLEESDGQHRAQLKEEILGYNRDDVMATLQLEKWLRSRFSPS